jgi:hypothetical protein
MRVAIVAPAGSYPAEFNGDKEQDHFWVECNPDESELLWNLQSLERRSRRIQCSAGNWRSGSEEPLHTFLVSRDGRHVGAFDWYYPFAGQWNGDNPFLLLPKELTLASVGDVAKIAIPDELRN